MNGRKVLATVGTFAAIGFATPASAEPTAVQLSMASYAASTAGANAEAAVAAKLYHLRETKASRSEGDGQNGTCPDCAICAACEPCIECKSEDCSGDGCHGQDQANVSVT